MTSQGLVILRGDARSLALRSASIDCCVTSPPYWGLRDYGVPGQLGLETTPDLYVEHMVSVFEEVRRAMKSAGTLWLNLGDCYATGAGRVGTEPGGGEQGARWRGEGSKADLRKFATNTVEPKAAHGIGPMTQPNRMPLAGLKPKDLVGIPWRVAFALQAAGWWLRSDIVWSKPNPMPESIKDRPTRSHEYVFLLTKSERYFYDADAIAEPFSSTTYERMRQPACNGDPNHGATRANRGYDTRDAIPGMRHHARKRETEAARAPQAGDPPHTGLQAAREAWRSKTAVNPHAAGRRQAPEPGERNAFGANGRNARSVWTISTQPYRGAHFATFPEELARRCIISGCPVGGIVLDPFAGSGTVGKVAIENGRSAVLIDLAYHDQAVKRTSVLQRPLL